MVIGIDWLSKKVLNIVKENSIVERNEWLARKFREGLTPLWDQVAGSFAVTFGKESVIVLVGLCFFSVLHWSGCGHVLESEWHPTNTGCFLDDDDLALIWLFFLLYFLWKWIVCHCKIAREIRGQSTPWVIRPGTLDYMYDGFISCDNQQSQHFGCQINKKA